MLGAKILLVEDERIVAHHLRRQLTTLGYEVTDVVATGQQALERIEKQRPALVLMDINIEGEIDGIETASRVPDSYHIPIVYLTAYSEEATLERARATRPYGYLLKPFAERELHATIQMALERRQTEIALRASEDRLRQAQKMEVIGQLAGGVAHDFNNLLAIISGNLELIQELAESGPMQEMIRDAQDAAGRGASLTQQLLAYSRQQPLEPQVLNVGGLVSDLTELLGRTLGETVEIRTRMPQDLWRARVDPRQLENAILNLALNARDAMPEGGRMTIEGSNVILDEHYAEQQVEVSPGPYVMLAVTDTGTGMAPEVVDKALEPFFTTKAVGHGTGLGLSMVFGFVKQSNGHIKIYSELGTGTSVKIYLPQAESDEDADSAHRHEMNGPPGARLGETVLLVEDDPMVRKLAVRLLSALGYQIIEAENGPDAIARMAEATRVDLLLTDLVLPQGMNGTVLAKRLQSERPGLKAVFMSGYASSAIFNHGVLDDGVPLLSKPFRKAELAHKLRQVLDAEPTQ